MIDNLLVMENTVAVADRLSKHLVLAVAIGINPLPEIQQNTSVLMSSIPQCSANLMNVVTDSIAKATTMGGELVTRIMTATERNPKDPEFPSVVRGICDFIRKVIDGDWINDCLEMAIYKLDALVLDPYAPFYVPAGFPPVQTPADLSQLIASAIDGKVIHDILVYQDNLIAALLDITSCSDASYGRVSRGFDGLHLADALMAKLGQMMAGVVSLFRTGLDYLDAFEECLETAELVCPGITTACGISTYKDLLATGASADGMKNSAMTFAMDKLNFKQEMREITRWWL